MIEPSSKLSGYTYAIRDIVAAAEALEREGREVIHLNIGDPQAFGFRPPEHVVEAVQRALRDRFTGYAHSAGLFEAREAVARHTTELGSPTNPQDVIMTSGASEAAELVLSALLNPGDAVLLPAPGYPLYAAILAKLGAIPRYYQLDPTNNWRPSPEEILSLIENKVRAIVLINPNNPTGAITPDEITAEMIELAAAMNVLVISDEVYRELCFLDQPSPASALAESIGVPLITLESLSKTYMLSGWRVGWMRFTNADKMPDLVAAITKLASGRLCSPTPAQYAVKPALESDDTFRNAFLSEIRCRRDFATSQVASIEGLFCTTPHAAFYLIVRADTPTWLPDERFVLRLLEGTGVLVVPGSGFGCDSRDGYFRMVYLADKATLSRAFDEIRRFMTATQQSRRGDEIKSYC